MTRLEETLLVDRPVEEVFAFVGDFANVARWDPGVEESEMLSEGPIRVGTRYRVVSVFNGRRLQLTYEVTAWDPPHRVILRGEGATFRGTDDIRFEPTPDGGTRITYLADLNLRGVLRVAEPFLRHRFEQLGRDAIDGMARALRA